MNKVIIKILQSSVVTQTVFGGLTIYRSIANFLQCISSYVTKLWKLVGSRQSYCNNEGLLFSPPCK